MSVAVRRLALAEGMDTHARPSDIISAYHFKKNTERDNIINLSVTIAKMVIGSDDPLESVAHLFTSDELQAIREQRAEAEQRKAEAQQLALLQRLTNAGRHKH